MTRKELSAALGCEIGERDVALFERAFTRSTYANEHAGAESYERLECLGDKVLGLIVMERLYRERPGDAGDLTQAQKKLVSRDPLTRASAGAGLPAFIRWGKGERPGDKVLSDVYEAVVAALYLGKGMAEARAFVERTLLAGQPLAEMDVSPQAIGDYIAALNERTCGRYECACAADGEGGQTAEISFEGRVIGRGRGKNRKEAEQAAAKEGLERLGGSEGKR